MPTGNGIDRDTLGWRFSGERLDDRFWKAPCRPDISPLLQVRYELRPLRTQHGCRDDFRLCLSISVNEGDYRDRLCPPRSYVMLAKRRDTYGVSDAS